MTDFTNLNLGRLPKIPDLKLSTEWNSVVSYVWVLEELISYYLGISNLEGIGWLFDNWLLIEKELITNGKVAVVYYGKRLLIANVNKMESNFEGEITKLDVTFLGDDKVRNFSKKQDRVVIFRNNIFAKGDFANLVNETKKLDMYLELIRHSLEMTKDTLIIKTKGKISQKAEQNIVEGLSKGKVVNIYYEDRKTKQPVDPDSYSYELKGGDWKQREFYWKEYDGILEGIYHKYKIRHIDSADKFSRTNNPEVYSNLASYWAWEKHRGCSREVGIREFMEKFPKEGKYRLKYGFIFSSQSEEKKENKVSVEQKKKEKVLEKNQVKEERVEVIEEVGK